VKAIATALIIAALIVTTLALSAGAAYQQQQETARAQAATRQLEAQVALVAASGQAEIDRAVAESVRTVNAAARADTAAAHPAAAMPAWATGSAAGLLAAAVFIVWNARRRPQANPQHVAQLAAAVAAAIVAQHRAEISAAPVIEVAPRPAEQPAKIVLF